LVNKTNLIQNVATSGHRGKALCKDIFQYRSKDTVQFLETLYISKVYGIIM